MNYLFCGFVRGGDSVRYIRFMWNDDEIMIRGM